MSNGSSHCGVMTNTTPESGQAALHALTTWARQHRTIRPRLVAAAWRAGVRNIRGIARAAEVSRDTIYSDLTAEGIDYRDRTAAAAPDPHPAVTTRPAGSYTVQVVITTYGTLHRTPPDETALVVNLTSALRNPPEDPAVRERLAQLDGLHPEVRAYVLDTPGALDIVGRTADQVRALVTGWGNPTGLLVRVHVVCQGGRHRSVVVAEEVATWLRAAGIGVEVDHLDIARPVVA